MQPATQDNMNDVMAVNQPKVSDIHHCGHV